MDFEKDNKKLFIIFGILYFIVIVIILIIIWHPKDDNSNVFAYSDYTEEEAYNKYALLYANDISLDLALQDYRALFEKVDSSFIENNKLNIDNFNAYLKNNGYYGNGITSDRYDIIKAGDVIIYPMRFKIYNEYKDLNIIEKSPYDYKISFGNDYTNILSNETNRLYKEYVSNDIRFVVQSVKNTRDEISIKFNITNVGNNKVQIDFDRFGSIKVVAGSKNKEYDKSVEVRATQFNTLKKDSDMSTTIEFSIPVSDQTDIKSIIFVGVRINDNEGINIEIPIE